MNKVIACIALVLYCIVSCCVVMYCIDFTYQKRDAASGKHCQLAYQCMHYFVAPGFSSKRKRAIVLVIDLDDDI